MQWTCVVELPGGRQVTVIVTGADAVEATWAAARYGRLLRVTRVRVTPLP